MKRAAEPRGQILYPACTDCFYDGIFKNVEIRRQKLQIINHDKFENFKLLVN